MVKILKATYVITRYLTARCEDIYLSREAVDKVICCLNGLGPLPYAYGP